MAGKTSAARSAGGRPGRADDVALTDLDVITRWSLAVRTAEADREELIAVLQADLAWLEQGRPAAGRASRPRAAR